MQVHAVNSARIFWGRSDHRGREESDPANVMLHTG